MDWFCPISLDTDLPSYPCSFKGNYTVEKSPIYLGNIFIAVPGKQVVWAYRVGEDPSGSNSGGALPLIFCIHVRSGPIC